MQSNERLEQIKKRLEAKVYPDAGAADITFLLQQIEELRKLMWYIVENYDYDND